jgi:hypothetical protein
MFYETDLTLVYNNDDVYDIIVREFIKTKMKDEEKYYNWQTIVSLKCFKFLAPVPEKNYIFW